MQRTKPELQLQTKETGVTSGHAAAVAIGLHHDLVDADDER